MTYRAERVGDLLRSELARILRDEVSDPRLRLATVSSVAVSRDLAHAEVRVSVIGDEAARTDGVAALRHAKGFVRSQLARRLRLRSVPDLVFELDRSAEHSQRISDILESLHDASNEDS